MRHNDHSIRFFSNYKFQSKYLVFSLQVGEPYRLDVFIAERFKCDSNLLIQTSGVQFVRQWDETLAVDYISDVSENIHVGSLVQV